MMTTWLWYGEKIRAFHSIMQTFKLWNRASVFLLICINVLVMLCTAVLPINFQINSRYSKSRNKMTYPQGLANKCSKARAGKHYRFPYITWGMLILLCHNKQTHCSDYIGVEMFFRDRVETEDTTTWIITSLVSDWKLKKKLNAVRQRLSMCFQVSTGTEALLIFEPYYMQWKQGIIQHPFS